MTDSIFELVFFAILIIGWILKAIADQREEKRRRERPAPEDADEAATAPAPPRPGRPPRGPPPMPPPIHHPRRPAPPPRPEGLGLAGSGFSVAESPLRARPIDTAAFAGKTSQIRKRRREEVIRRLAGGAPIRPGRSLTRAGVLWSEVLAFPRAVTGPHRSPAARRRDRR